MTVQKQIDLRMIEMIVNDNRKSISLNQKGARELLEAYKNQKAITELAVKALEEVNTIYMRYIENEIECDTAATRMDNVVEDALSSIQSLGGNETP